MSREQNNAKETTMAEQIKTLEMAGDQAAVCLLRNDAYGAPCEIPTRCPWVDECYPPEPPCPMCGATDRDRSAELEREATAHGMVVGSCERCGRPSLVEADGPGVGI